MFADRLPENGAGACRLPDPADAKPVYVSPCGNEMYAGSTGYREIGGEEMFPACADLAKWLVRSGRARRTSEGFCEMCGEQATFEYEGHKACDVICLSDLLDEYGLVERVTMEEAI